MVITSVNNSHIKDIYKLREKKYRDKDNLFLVETFHLVEEAVKSGCVKEVILSEGYDIDFSGNKIYVSDMVMNKLSSTNSNPKVIAVCNRLLESDDIGKRVIILDNIQDPGNLGAIIRSAVAFNFDSIILSNDSVDLYNSKVIRATQGMMFHINIVIRDLKEVIPILKEKEIPIYGTRVDYG